MARPAGWINFEYHNISDTGNDLTIETVPEPVVATYTITASAGANGTITPAGAVSVSSGASQTFLITPDYGYHVSNITVDGSSTTAAGAYTFSNVVANHTIFVSFDVTVISGGYVDTKFTGGSVFGQQDWSGGSGQSDFTNSNQYFSDDGNISNTNTPPGLELKSYGNNSYVQSGSLISSTFDTGTDSPTYINLTWQPSGPGIEFQVATSATDDQNTVWNFLGPDGTSATYYTSPSITNPANNGRYFRYEVFLSGNGSTTPVLSSVSVNYISGCTTPGQAIFAGLSSTPKNYQLTISAPGYQTQTLNNLTIKNYNAELISLSH